MKGLNDESIPAVCRVAAVDGYRECKTNIHNGIQATTVSIFVYISARLFAVIGFEILQPELTFEIFVLKSAFSGRGAVN